MSNCPAFRRKIRCAEQIQKKILQAEEGEVHDNEVEDFVIRDLDSLNCHNALSSACPDLETFTTALMHHPFHCPIAIRAIVCMKLFHSVSADYP